MRTPWSIAGIIVGLLIAVSCTPDNEDRCGDSDKYYWEGHGCREQDTGSADGDSDGDADGDSDGDADVDGGGDYDPEQWIGSACTCEGADCSMAGAPVPHQGTIVDCDDTPGNWPGAAKVCLRSYGGPLGVKTYYANGYCSVVATKCEGEAIICGTAVMGTFDDMTSCPSGSVLVTSVQEIALSGMTATVDNKTCALACDDDSGCRTGETDPDLNGEATQYACLDKDGVKFCHDPRNLTGDYTAEAF